MDPQLAILFAVLSAAFAVIGILLAVRNWVYGGSIVRVELELARKSSWGAIVTRPVAAWRTSTGEELRPTRTMMGTQVDLAKVTVRNLGRTAATVYDIGLRVGPPPAAHGTWTAQPQFFTDAGETEDRVRLEAHDVQVFYFHTVPILRGARSQFGERNLAVRAAVNTGVGRWRLSSRWRRGHWNVWIIKGDRDRSVIGKPLTMREQARLWVELLRDFDGARDVWVRQIADQAADQVDAGLSRDEVYARGFETHRLFGTPADPRAEEFYIRMLVDNLIALRDSEGSARSLVLPDAAGGDPTEPIGER